jgi:plastocyanin
MKRALTIAIMLCGALALASGFTRAASHPSFRIILESVSPYYKPASATVMIGTAIRWENPTATYHTITHDGCITGGRCLFDSGSIPPDGSYTIPALPPGRYPYQCRLHPIMRGVLTVVEPAPFTPT